MANRKLVSGAVKGVVVLGAKYGPHLYEAIKHGREPAQAVVQAQLARRNARKNAIEHARTVRDGSILKVIHDGTAHFVVLSNDLCVAVYPPTQAGYAELLRHSDLSKRERPDDQPASPLRRLRLPLPLPRRRRR